MMFEYPKQWSSTHKDYEKDVFRKHGIVKGYANTLITAWTQMGVIVSPNICSRCGGSKPSAYGKQDIIAHHDNYLLPFDVKWLCTGCHGKRHAELFAAKKDPRTIFYQESLESPGADSYLTRLRQFYSQVSALSSELCDFDFHDPIATPQSNLKLSISYSDEAEQRTLDTHRGSA